MPALPDVPNVVRVATVGTFGNDIDVVNRVYFRVNTPGATPLSLNTFCASVASAWNTRLAALFDQLFTLTSTNAEDLTSAVSPVGVASTSHAGTRGGAAISGSACALVQNKIGRRYRGGHPRTYLAALTDADQASLQTWIPASLTSLTTAWSQFMSDIGGALTTAYGAANSDHVNVSYYEGFTNVTYPSGRTYPRPTLRVSPLVDTVIGYSANPNIASQRRRNLTP